LTIRGSATVRSKVGKQRGLTIPYLDWVHIGWVEWEDEESPWAGGKDTRLITGWGIRSWEAKVLGGAGSSGKVSTRSWEV